MRRNLFTEIYEHAAVMIIPNSSTAPAVMASSRQLITATILGS